MNYKLPSSEQKASYVQSNFDQIAVRYNLFNDVITFGMHRYWKRYLVNRLGLSDSSVCLDLCCGTGDLSKVLHDNHPNSKIISLDFSRGMLELAKNRFTGNKNVSLMLGDAMSLPLADQSIDAITLGFGLRNVSNINSALSEVYRVLKPGGIFACLDVGKIGNRTINQLNLFYFFRVVPFIGKLMIKGHEMFDYLPHSSIKYPSQFKLKRMLLSAKFAQVDIHSFLFGASVIHFGYKA